MDGRVPHLKRCSHPRVRASATSSEARTPFKDWRATSVASTETVSDGQEVETSLTSEILGELVHQNRQYDSVEQWPHYPTGYPNAYYLNEAGDLRASRGRD